jgi:uncharacterized protein DUF4339
MEDTRTFYVRRRGRIEGPWTILKLKAEVALYKLGKHHEVSTDKVAWSRAGEIKELFATDVKRKSLGKTTAEEVPDQNAITTAPYGSAATAEWYYCTDENQQVGPISLLELVEAVMTGKVALDGLAWRDGFGDWLPIEDVPEIRAVLDAQDAGGGTDTAATRFVAPAVLNTRSQKATIALGIGLASMFLAWIPFTGFLGFFAIVLGGFAIREIRQSNGQKTGVPLAIAGMVTGALGVLGALLTLFGLAIWLFWT